MGLNRLGKTLISMSFLLNYHPKPLQDHQGMTKNMKKVVFCILHSAAATLHLSTVKMLVHLLSSQGFNAY